MIKLHTSVPVNTSTKILNKILVSGIQPHIKRIINHEVGFIQGWKDNSKPTNQWNIHQQIEEEKSHDYLNKHRTFDKIQHPFMIKSLKTVG